jgi:NAD(P)-dependent dehydrogenase (short-subunit alcohol dehydrogenase family)
MPAIPQYSASKHALVGLVRSLGRSPAALEKNVRINAVCPAIVATDAIPATLLAGLPADQITPMATVIRAFDALGDFSGVAAAATKPSWVETGPSGETVEANVEALIWHSPPVPEGGEHAKFERQKASILVAAAFKDKKARQLA